MSGIRLGLLVAMLALTGCAMRPNAPDGAVDWTRRAAELVSLSSWSASGRIAVKSGADGGQGDIRWTQDGPDARIELHGPFGVGAYRIDWTDRHLVVTGRAGEASLAYAGPDAVERFMIDQFGWSFPARSIRYWMLGVADPRYPSRVGLDDDGWLVSFEQNGWFVTYDRFVAVQGRWMPRRIVMEHEHARVKMIVDEWRLQSL